MFILLVRMNNASILAIKNETHARFIGHTEEHIHSTSKNDACANSGQNEAHMSTRLTRMKGMPFLLDKTKSTLTLICTDVGFGKNTNKKHNQPRHRQTNQIQRKQKYRHL